MTELLTIDELATWLKFTRRQVYELTSKRGQSTDHPLPVFKINGNIRFKKSDVENWIGEISGKAA